MPGDELARELQRASLGHIDSAKKLNVNPVGSGPSEDLAMVRCSSCAGAGVTVPAQ